MDRRLSSSRRRVVSPAIACAALLLLAALCHGGGDLRGAGGETPGFLWGLWHGFIFPFAWIGSLFDPEIAVYAVPNNGGWYDFGYFLGITVLGGGSWFGSKARKRG